MPAAPRIAPQQLFQPEDSAPFRARSAVAGPLLVLHCWGVIALAVALGYRVLLWVKPEAGGEALFLFLMGGALGAHLLFTWDSLTQVRQPDLDAAGGVLFSWSLIAIVNALVILLLLKGLFPDAVPLLERLREAGALVRRFWSFAWLWSKPALGAVKSRLL